MNLRKSGARRTSVLEAHVRIDQPPKMKWHYPKGLDDFLPEDVHAPSFLVGALNVVQAPQERARLFHAYQVYLESYPDFALGDVNMGLLAGAFLRRRYGQRRAKKIIVRVSRVMQIETKRRQGHAQLRTQTLPG